MSLLGMQYGPGERGVLKEVWGMLSRHIPFHERKHRQFVADTSDGTYFMKKWATLEAHGECTSPPYPK
jgi:hypothetical protein